MKKIILISIAIFLSNSFAFAQRAKVFDNFDTSAGVRVITTSVAPIAEAKPQQTPKKESKNASKPSDSLALKNKLVKTSYVRLTMSGGDSMGGFTTGDSQVDGFIVKQASKCNQV